MFRIRKLTLIQIFRCEAVIVRTGLGPVVVNLDKRSQCSMAPKRVVTILRKKKIDLQLA